MLSCKQIKGRIKNQVTVTLKLDNLPDFKGVFFYVNTTMVGNGIIQKMEGEFTAAAAWAKIRFSG